MRILVVEDDKDLNRQLSEAMVDAASRAAARGVYAMTGFTFRRVPAATLARDIVASGRLGRIYQVRASYLQDWLADPAAPYVWRLDKSLAGSGALGDIGAHAVDLAQFITGSRLTAVSGILETLIPSRDGRDVTVDDLALFTGRFDSGVLANFEATRFATGRKNALRIEVSGSDGAISFDLEEMNSLQYYDATAPQELRGFTSIPVTEPVHPYIAAWWPPGHTLGYEHGFSNQVRDFVVGITSGTQPTPSFADGLQVQRVLAAIEESSANGSAWSAV